MAEGREPITKDNPVYRPIPEGMDQQARAKMPELLSADRKGNFNEVELGYDEAQGKEEAHRCLNCGYCCECYQCVEACGAGAVTLETHAQKPEIINIDVGSVILAPGFEPFDPSKLNNYIYAEHPNVITAIEFERFLSASGPTEGHLMRPSDHKEPEKIAWIQCVGSRDMNRCDNPYCSSVCCMYAIKEAVIAKEHAGDDLDCAIFFMDMRTHGKDFERAYNEAKEKQGVRFIRSRIHTVFPVPGSDDLSFQYVTETGETISETFNLIVLSVGLETPKSIVELAERLEIELTQGNFCKTKTFAPVETSREGIFACGAFQGPRDIPQSVVDASAAAAAAGEIISSARHTLTRTREIIPEINVAGERPRIGVFVCKCGINIAGIVDVPAVTEYSSGLPYVEYVENNLFTCSLDTQETITKVIREQNLNRVVVTACTPKTHEPMFQETLINAGLNKYLFEFVNIRNHDSWVHRAYPELATEKAKDLVRMAVAKVALMEPLDEAALNITQTVMVLGGGPAGMAAAKSLALQGYETHLVERSGRLGGQALKIFRTGNGEDVRKRLSELITEIEKNKNIYLHLDTTLENVEGFVGNFSSALSSRGEEQKIDYGVAVIATGACEFQPEEHCFGKDPRIITALGLDKKFMRNDPSLKNINSAVFIQCVGSRDKRRPYCSRVCCTHTMERAIHLKQINPEINVYVFYRDIRTYGEHEYLYKKAREKDVIFIRYTIDNKPEVIIKDGGLSIKATDPVIGLDIEIEADMLTLATAIVPYKDEKLARFFKIPVNDDGFFMEKHAKLGPSDFATDGVFLCGLAHYPKPVEEAITHGQAAASRATTLLAQQTINTSGNISCVNTAMCSGCGVCVVLCPFSAASIMKEGPFAGK